jgi:hypothetical protein
MRLSQFFGRQRISVTRRSRPVRRPVVEALEGRQLLSGFTVTPAIVGQHIGTPAIVGKHIGTPAIVGQHIGSNVV